MPLYPTLSHNWKPSCPTQYLLQLNWYTNLITHISVSVWMFFREISVVRVPELDFHMQYIRNIEIYSGQLFFIHTIIQKLEGGSIFLFHYYVFVYYYYFLWKKWILLFRNGIFNTSDSKDVLQSISISNKGCFQTFYSPKNPDKKIIYIYNHIYNHKKCFLSSKSVY